MATTSITAAVLAKYDALTAALFPGGVRPGRAFDEMPSVDGAGNQISAESGYVVIKGISGPSQPLAFGRVTNESLEIVWEIYYPDLGDALKSASAIRFNGGSPHLKQGFDGGTLPDLTAPPTVRDIVYLGTEQTMAGHGKTNKLVHLVRVRHRICLTRSGS